MLTSNQQMKLEEAVKKILNSGEEVREIDDHYGREFMTKLMAALGAISLAEYAAAHDMLVKAIAYYHKLSKLDQLTQEEYNKQSRMGAYETLTSLIGDEIEIIKDTIIQLG